MEKFTERLAWAYKKAQEVNDKENKRNKKNYDRKVRYSKLEVGDKVLVRQKAFKGKHKIQGKWEDDIYKVISQPIENFPVFTVQHKGSKTLKLFIGICYFPLGLEFQCVDESHKVHISEPMHNNLNTKIL